MLYYWMLFHDANQQKHTGLYLSCIQCDSCREGGVIPMHSIGINEGKSRVGGATDESSFTLIMTAKTICYSDRLYV